LPTYFLDLTPFVPVLTDRKPHNISLDVVSAESNHTINANWYVSGNLQVVTDSSSNPTTGNITKYTANPYAVSSIIGEIGKNGDVNVTVRATRQIHIESTILSGSGKSTKVVWSQNLSYQNVQNYLKNASIQVSTGNLPDNFLCLNGWTLECCPDCDWHCPVDPRRGNDRCRSLLIPVQHQFEHPEARWIRMCVGKTSLCLNQLYIALFSYRVHRPFL
jgi:hypothetical protein